MATSNTAQARRSFRERLTDAEQPSTASPAREPKRPRPNLSAVRQGVLIAVAIVLYAIQAPVLGAVYGLGAWGMLLALPGSAGVIVAHRNARAGVGVVLLGTALITIALLPGGLFSDGADAFGLPVPWTVCSMLALYACTLLLGYSVAPRDFLVTYGALILASVVLEIVSGGFTGAFFVMSWISLGMGALGLGVRQLLASEERAKRSEQVSEQERAQRSLLQEKAQVARELHDVVAHHMSVIAVQASSAEYRIDGLSTEAQREFREIGDQARASLAELRRILGVLRGDEAQMQRAPQPGVEDLPRIIDSVRRAGTPVEFDGDDLDGVDRSVSIATYRIVQESLSNVLRHAPGAPARVVVRRSESAVEILVSNPAPAAPRQDVPGTGHGIRGMAERANALGGNLSAEATDDGGFTVVAWLPLATADSALGWNIGAGGAR